MRFTERHQRYGGISRIKREGSVLAGALFVLGGTRGVRKDKGVLGGVGGNGRGKGAWGF